MPSILTVVTGRRVSIRICPLSRLNNQETCMRDDSETVSKYARRDFLKLTSISVVGVTVAGAWPTFALAASASPLSVGYASSEPEDGGHRSLVAADSMLMGDPSFLSHDAKVTIRSSFRSVAATKQLDSVAIDVVFPELGANARSYPSFRAWSSGSDGFRHLSSRRVTFRVPMDGMNGLLLNFVREASAATKNPNAGHPDASVTLGLGSSSGEPKLQRGIYVVAFRESNDSADPVWGRLDLTRRGSELAISGGSFSYVIFSVDYER